MKEVTPLPIRILFIYSASALVLVAAYNLPPAQDWMEFFRPSALTMLHGGDPYSIKDFHNAPWSLLPLIPLALLPIKLGRAMLLVISLAAFAYIAYRLHAKPISMILFVTCFPVVTSLHGGGIDWLAMLSFVTPPPVSLVLASIKPQVGLGISVYWLLLGWELGGLRLVLRWTLPAILLLAASFILYGPWILSLWNKWNNPFNVSIFPLLVPLGLYMLWTKRKDASSASSLFFAPYHTVFSLVVPISALLKYPKLLALAWVVSWCYLFLK